MKRNAMTRREKDLLSRLSKIINYSEFIHANLTIARRTCGNPRCRCIREGKKHVSLYLTTTRKDGKRKSIYIPKRLEEDAKAAVARYFKIKDILEEVSDINLARLLEEKKKR
jgi:hypothetical protein